MCEEVQQSLARNALSGVDGAFVRLTSEYVEIAKPVIEQRASVYAQRMSWSVDRLRSTATELLAAKPRGSGRGVLPRCRVGELEDIIP